MRALIDADILRYEIGYGAETGWGGEDRPSWNYVEKLLHERIDRIVNESGADSYSLYLTEGPTFRFKIARQKPYKGSRHEDKPWHFANLSAYLKALPETVVVEGIEADDHIAIDHIADPDTIICSRDKDLRQVPGWFYSWELGNQPSFGPIDISREGDLRLDSRGHIKGTGLAFFYAQVLMGDTVDNIPGCPKIGPQKAFGLLEGKTTRQQLEAVIGAYRKVYGPLWKPRLLEQGRLCWMTRRISNGYPVMWRIGMEN